MFLLFLSIVFKIIGSMQGIVNDVTIMQKGDFVEVEYVGRIKESGDIFDLTSEELAKEKKVHNKNYKYGPVVVIIGARHVLPGIDEQLEKMQPSDKATFDVLPEKGFGKRSDELTKIFQMAEFRKQKVVPVVGQQITFQNGARGKIISVASGRVKVDFNHPLSGKVLQYDVKLNKQITDVNEQISSILAFYLGSKMQLERKVTDKKLEIRLPQGANFHPQVKKIIADEIIKYVKDIEEVNFAESFK